ncbi:hypothetical protein F4777DRAFT_546551 [Nemania sp. FL0916]|nr:hypothetical protein F4777DRAFT_546551 [Nemania sp. FL0916]
MAGAEWSPSHVDRAGAEAMAMAMTGESSASAGQGAWDEHGGNPEYTGSQSGSGSHSSGSDSGDVSTQLQPSKRVHILGFTTRARFLAHALASTPDIPVGMLVHNLEPIKRWDEEHRRLSLYDARGQWASSVPLPCPRLIWERRQYLDSPEHAYYLSHVIVDTQAAAIVRSLQYLRPRIDRQTTICLLHDGLGLVERIHEEVFPDPRNRPNIVLGHSSYVLGRISGTMYSLKRKKPGSLLLHGIQNFDHAPRHTIYTGMPQPAHATRDASAMTEERMRQTQNFVGLLSPNTLNTVSLPWVRFLCQKLPNVIFSSVADAVSVILGCRYSQIYPNYNARSLWDSLLDETLAIVAQFPELQEVPHQRDAFLTSTFRRKLSTYRISLRNNVSPWVKQVRYGIEPPVAYANGYFIRRARELGLEHKLNSMAEEVVNARVSARRIEIKIDLLGTSAYMTDSDLIGGGQPPPTMEEILDDDHL